MLPWITQPSSEVLAGCCEACSDAQALVMQTPVEKCLLSKVLQEAAKAEVRSCCWACCLRLRGMVRSDG
jgi:hypothetical protein